MNSRAKAWILAVTMMVALFLAMAQGAHAQTKRLKADLPPTETPDSGKFDITGRLTLTSNGQGGTINIVGSGAFSGNDYQMDVSYSLEDPPPGAGPTEFSASIIVLDGKVYFKTTGLGGESDDKWYVMDIPAGTATPGMGNPLAVPPGYEEVFTSTRVGKETINGVETTKYRIDVDLKRLYEMAGAPSREAAELAEATTIEMFVWIGDADMYVYKITQHMTTESTDPNLDLHMDYDYAITYKEFNTPVTITAPPDAEPVDASGSIIVPGMPAGMPTGMPGGMPSGMPTGMTGMGMGTGMPKTGAGSQAGMPWALISVGALLVVGGYAIRRRAAATS